MKRISSGRALGVALVAAGRRDGRRSRSRPPRPPRRRRSTRSSRRCPPTSSRASRWIIGVKCDVPPFGYIDVKGKNAGFDVEIARWFARYAFGRDNRVSFVCAPTAVREPLLTNNRVDLVISTFTYTADRDTRIDFSRAYYKATGRLLVKNDGPVQKLSDIKRQEGRDDERLGLRPLDEALLPGHRRDRRGHVHERPARVPAGPRRRGHVRRRRAAAGRGGRPRPRS